MSNEDISIGLSPTSAIISCGDIESALASLVIIPSKPAGPFPFTCSSERSRKDAPPAPLNEYGFCDSTCATTWLEGLCVGGGGEYPDGGGRGLCPPLRSRNASDVAKSSGLPACEGDPPEPPGERADEGVFLRTGRTQGGRLLTTGASGLREHSSGICVTGYGENSQNRS